MCHSVFGPAGGSSDQRSPSVTLMLFLHQSIDLTLFISFITFKSDSFRLSRAEVEEYNDIIQMYLTAHGSSEQCA